MDEGEVRGHLIRGAQTRVPPALGGVDWAESTGPSHDGPVMARGSALDCLYRQTCRRRAGRPTVLCPTLTPGGMLSSIYTASRVANP